MVYLDLHTKVASRLDHGVRSRRDVSCYTITSNQRHKMLLSQPIDVLSKNPKPLTKLMCAEATIALCQANLDCAYSVQKQINRHPALDGVLGLSKSRLLALDLLKNHVIGSKVSFFSEGAPAKILFV